MCPVDTAINLYKPRPAFIEEIREETSVIKTFVLRPKEGHFRFHTGQFIELTLPGIGEAPFTPSSDPNITRQIEVTIMNVGKVTSLLHQAKVGTQVGIRGPYGKGYPLEEFSGKQILIVGGGVGLAPLRSLLFALFSQMERYSRLILCYGARSPQDIVYKDMLAQWAEKEKVDVFVTIDVGSPQWQGRVGLVTTLLDTSLGLDIDKSVAVVCGPPIMMKFVTLKLLDLGFQPHQIYLSMEKNMSCGLGKCGHCRLGRYYVCKDGPVFNYAQLKDIPEIWD